MNGFCGIMSIFSSLRYCLGPPDDYTNLWFALALMPFGLFFDFMDGKVARWRKKSSLMGQELDSLADLVRAFSELTSAPHRTDSVYPRSHLASLPPSPPLPSDYEHLWTISSSPSSCSVVCPVSLASTLLLRPCPRMLPARHATSRERRSPRH